MARRVAGHVDDVEREAQGFDAPAAAHRLVRAGDPFRRGTENLRARGIAHGIDAADVVRVVVRD